MNFNIEKISNADQDAVVKIIKSFWGSETILVHDTIFNITSLDGLKATLHNQIVGILHYQIRGVEFEILTLASVNENHGIGTALLRAVESLAKDSGCQRLSLITTNDNLHALGFYQRRGFYLAALYPGKVMISRHLKPEIPESGNNKIPIRDEIRLVKIIQ